MSSWHLPELDLIVNYIPSTYNTYKKSSVYRIRMFYMIENLAKLKVNITIVLSNKNAIGAQFSWICFNWIYIISHWKQWKILNLALKNDCCRYLMHYGVLRATQSILVIVIWFSYPPPHTYYFLTFSDQSFFRTLMLINLLWKVGQTMMLSALWIYWVRILKNSRLQARRK